LNRIDFQSTIIKLTVCDSGQHVRKSEIGNSSISEADPDGAGGAHHLSRRIH
jgi:hypothetical protein